MRTNWLFFSPLFFLLIKTSSTVVEQRHSLLSPWQHAGFEVAHERKPDKSSFGKENRVILSLRVGKNYAENPGWACSSVVGCATVPAERGVTSDSVRKSRRQRVKWTKNVTFLMLLPVSWEGGEVISCIWCNKAPLGKQSLRFRHNLLSRAMAYITHMLSIVSSTRWH